MPLVHEPTLRANPSHHLAGRARRGVWWASKQDAPEIPQRRRRHRLAAGGARAVRGRHAAARRALAPDPRITRVSHASRPDCYALTPSATWATTCCPPAPARCSGWCCCSPRCDASKRTVLGHGRGRAAARRDRAGRDLRGRGLRRAQLDACCRRDRPLLMAGIGVLVLLAAAVAVWVLRRHHVFERARDWLRPLADAPRALLGREGVLLLVGTFVIWALEAGVYLAVARAVDLDISMTGALYLVALTNFFAVLPAAPGYDRHLRRRGGVRRTAASGPAARPRSPTCCCCASCSSSRSRSSGSWCWSRATAAGRAPAPGRSASSRAGVGERSRPHARPAPARPPTPTV